MLQAAIDAALLAVQPVNLLWILLGSLIGLFYGAMPGLGGVAAMSLVLPFTFGMETRAAMLVFSGIMGSVSFGGSVSAILLNTPGTSANVPTCLDGYPMTRRGEGARALAISATGGALGGVFGVIVLIVLMPALRTVALLFGPPEFFMLILFGLASIVVASKGNLLKGLLSGGLGLMLSFLGVSPITGMVRFGFGTEYLWDGIPLIPLMIGMFTIAELLNLGFSGSRSITEGNSLHMEAKGVLEGIIDVFRNWRCFLRSSAIGTLIGIIPGIGGAAANFISYTMGQQFSKHPEKFGTGWPEGVLASEAADNAKDGGALVPTLAFGIPGSSEMAVLLGAFVLHGLVPGPDMLRSHQDIVWIIIVGMVASNLVAATLGMTSANVLRRLTRIDLGYVIPVVGIFCLVGAYVLRRSLWDVLVTIFFGIIAYCMRRSGLSVITMAIGFILGPLAETAFHQSLMISYGDYLVFFRRPLSLFLFVIFLAVMFVPMWRKRRRRPSAEQAPV